MMRKGIQAGFMILGVLFSMSVFADKYKGEEKKNTRTNKNIAADCAPSSAVSELALNNVRFKIETGGSMWTDRAQSNAAYFVPKLSESGELGRISVLYAGALWMGGTDPAGNLKMAAIRFRQLGNDYWPGPLTNDGAASTTSDICQQYDRFWRTTQQQSRLHNLWWSRINDNDPDNDNDPPFDENPYVIPEVFFEWPGNGDISRNQDLILGPFFDQNDDGIYDPEQGDYPWYDLNGTIDCRNQRREDPVPLFGDENLFYIFNDNGNIHSESGGEPIGMEVRAQAFAFSSNDEINSMTFYNYVLINQGSLSLENTYFGQWVDFDLGTAVDDYTGCDVQRGLGYGYNGDPFDESSSSSEGYGAFPPAVGVDFFEGPYQDADGLDNPLILNYQEAIDNHGIPYKGIGIGYGDDVVDNERFGMRAFVYHNNNSSPQGDPQIAIEYYQYLQAIWRDGTPMTYGGTGYEPNNPNAQRAFYMFPNASDVIGWGTEGNVQDPWSEELLQNPVDDRRFIQSAGPFTLEPGNVNNITVGAVYARSSTGTPYESVRKVIAADDKAQNLFDACFQIVEGPDQPDQSIAEFDKKLILYLTNDNPVSNNFREQYAKVDPTIPSTVFDNGELIEIPEEDRIYNFEGYQIYQLANSSISVEELDDPDKARLIFQTDVQNDVDMIINFEFDDVMGLSVPVLKAQGSNEGIRHAFEITTDAFATNEVNLINFKTYCFIAVAYGYNNYYPFKEIDGEAIGQSAPYLRSRRSPVGSIQTICGVPHKIQPENGGTELNSNFGDGVEITRIEGAGTGGVRNFPKLKQSSIDKIMEGEPWRADVLEYEEGFGPVDIFVADPLTVKDASFTLALQNIYNDIENDTTFWVLTDEANPDDRIFGDRFFSENNEQLIPEYGLAINFSQYPQETNFRNDNPREKGFSMLVGAEIEYEDPDKAWLGGIPDQEGFNLLNWIRSGTISNVTDGQSFFPSDYLGQDDDEVYETVLNRTWAPFTMVQSDTLYSPAGENMRQFVQESELGDLHSVDVVFTSDKSKWTRAAVLEAQHIEELAIGGAEEKHFRQSPSRDRDGNTGTDEATWNGLDSVGFSWFPGYAIDVATGERLNIAFSEDSNQPGQNGADMLWNPTSTIITPFGQPILGGQHYIYIFKNLRALEPRQTRKSRYMPSYDYGAFFRENLDGSGPRRSRIFDAASWVTMPVLLPEGPGLLSLEDGLIPTKTTVRLRVAEPYRRYATVADEVANLDTITDQFDYLDSTDLSVNNWMPMYQFTTNGFGTSTGQTQIAKDFLSEIRAVPNPYQARSSYETSRIDNRIKFINLPQRATISIFNMGGTLVRRIEKDNPLTYQDWDMRNETLVPVASGTYIVHIDARDLGEKILKVFIVMRPLDLENF
jgi:hypothetical protein